MRSRLSRGVTRAYRGLVPTSNRLVLEGWWRGDSFASGTAIDLSSHGRDLPSISGAVTQVSRLGQLAMSFGGDRAIPDVLSASFGAVVSQPATIYIVAEVSTPDDGQGRYLFSGTSEANRLQLDMRFSNRFRMFAGVVRSSPTTYAYDTQHVAACVFNGEESKLYTTNFIEPEFVANTGDKFADGFTIGAAPDAATGGFTDPLPGYVWECIFYSGEHSLRQRRTIGTYLADRYSGLSISL